MRMKWLLTAAVLTTTLRTELFAQSLSPAIPGGTVPSAPTDPASAASSSTSSSAGGGGGNLWSYLCPTQQQKAACQQCICNTQIGQMLNSSLSAFSMFSGGMISGCCPNPNLTDLAGLNQPADGAEGAAARIKKEEADAKARRAAVRYLGTVDCQYFPNAEKALIAALRADTNECVRWEAAMSLGHGCCCTRKVIEALTLTVTCSTRDGNPAEKSWRVKGAAEAALEHCLSCYEQVSVAPAPKERPESPPPLRRPETPEPNIGQGPATLPEMTERQALVRSLAEARQAMARLAQRPPEVGQIPTGQHSVYNIVASAIQPVSVQPGRLPFPETASPPLVQQTATAPQQMPPTGQRSLFSLFSFTK